MMHVMVGDRALELPSGSSLLGLSVELGAAFMVDRAINPRPAPMDAWMRRLQRLVAKSATPRAWSVLRVTPNMERKVCDYLKEAGVLAYVPTEKYRPPNHWRPKTRALIPGYVFVLLESDVDLDIARANFAVRDLLCIEGRPVKAPALHIGSMIWFEGLGAFDSTLKQRVSRRRGRRGRKVEETVKRWEHGQLVRIKEESHALNGFVGQVLRDEGGSRIQVLLKLFGQDTRAELEEGWLEEVG